MRIGERRALTEGECALACGIFGERLELKCLRVLQAPPLGFQAMVPIGATIVFSLWRAARDFSLAPRDEQGWFLHELAHCWQAQRGIVLARAKLRALGAAAYQYRLSRGAAFSAYNIEQQAEIVRHLFLARLDATEPGMPSKILLENIWRGALNSDSGRPTPANNARPAL